MEKLPVSAAFHAAEQVSGGPAIAVVSAIPLVKDSLEAVIRASGEMRVWRGAPDGAPGAVLCGAACARGLRCCRELLPLHPWPPAVLYDLVDQLGPAVAGLHGFRGYLSGGALEAQRRRGEMPEERLLRCVRRVASGEVDAQRQHLYTLVGALEQPPLAPHELRVMELFAWGRTHQEVVRELGIPKGTFERCLSALLAAFDASSGHHLGTIAVAMGLIAPFEAEPPDLAQAALVRRAQKKRCASGATAAARGMPPRETETKFSRI